MLNSFVFNFDSPDKILRERMAYEFYGYPADFLDRFQAGVEKVTTADIARVAAKYVHKDQFAVLVVGNSAEFDKPLSSLGSVTNVDITIPPPPGEEPQPEAKPAASNSEGKALAAKLAAALGGKCKVTVHQVHREHLHPHSKDAAGRHAFVDEKHHRLSRSSACRRTGADGKFTVVISPSVSFMSMAGMGVRELPESQKTENLLQLKRDLIYVGQHASDPAFSFSAQGTEKIGDVDAQILDINGEGVSMRCYPRPAKWPGAA